MKKTIALGCSAALFGAALVPSAMALAAGPSASQWTIGPIIRGRNHSVNMPLHLDPAAGGASTFEFPRTGQGSVHYVTANTRPLAGARSITLRYRIDAAPGVRFVPDEYPEYEALLSLYFQRQGDGWTRRHPAHRWYSPINRTVPLKPGTHTVRIGLDEPWIAMIFKDNRAMAREFDAALQETAVVGFTFGHANGRGHGVSATGPARFTVLDYRIE